MFVRTYSSFRELRQYGSPIQWRGSRFRLDCGTVASVHAAKYDYVLLHLHIINTVSDKVSLHYQTTSWYLGLHHYLEIGVGPYLQANNSMNTLLIDPKMDSSSLESIRGLGAVLPSCFCGQKGLKLAGDFREMEEVNFRLWSAWEGATRRVRSINY